jgi:integrase/recombinase XerD
MSVTLRSKKNADGSTSLYMDIYHKGTRTKEYLKECKLVKASNPEDRVANKGKKELAKRITNLRSEELECSGYNIQAKHKGNLKVVDFFESYIKTYDKKDLRNVIGVFNAFKDYLSSKNQKNLVFTSLDENTVHQFAEYLKTRCTGEGASSYYARFKKVIKQAVREKIIIENPCIDVKIKKDYSIRKDILTDEEIATLYKTNAGNQLVKNAFLFSCFTGLRWADIVTLKWNDIDIEQKTLKKYQTKTDTKVEVPLGENALLFIPNIPTNEFVFNLPTHTGASKMLTKWVLDAKIKKKITWHCARHSFCTNLLIHDIAITTISSLAGHASLVETQRYVKVKEEMKRNAINVLPSLQLLSK